MRRTCIVALLGLALTGCSSTSTPSASPTRRVTVTVTASPTSAAGDKLSLRGACDNLDSVLATGGQDPRQAFTLLWSEVQGLANVSDEQGQSALQPLIDAARAGSEAKDVTQPRWQAAENSAYAGLEKKCDAAGSTALP